MGQEDGLRWIKPDADRALQVFCQSGWVLMQKRTGPSVNFYRNWMSYARGFGDTANFWLGNDNLHALTSGSARLWVSLEDDESKISCRDTDMDYTEKCGEMSHKCEIPDVY